jgi:hypothetical protein
VKYTCNSAERFGSVTYVVSNLPAQAQARALEGVIALRDAGDIGPMRPLRITQRVPRIQTPLSTIEGPKHTTSKGVGVFDGCGSDDGGAELAGGYG